ncbi:MAG: HAD family hydrolase [Myxococcota bacterium]
MATPFSDRRLDADARRTLLREVIRRTQDADRPVVVFDLDGTLLDNRARTVAIFNELADQTDDASMAAGLRRARVETTVYGLEENLDLLGVAASQHPAAFAFWRERFFHDDYMHHDVAMPGAVAFARAVYAAGANIVYLTGRDLPGMALGTFGSLRDEGFPIGVVGTELVVKPDFETPDATFKADVAQALGRLGEVVASFDNEAANCNLLLKHHPKSIAIFVDTLCAPNAPPLAPEVQVIDHFD